MRDRKNTQNGSFEISTLPAYGPYNYRQILYLLKKSEIYPHIDLISIGTYSEVSIEKPEIPLFDSLIDLGYKRKSNHWTKDDSNHGRICNFRTPQNTDMGVLYRKKPGRFPNTPPIRIIAHDPNKDLIIELDALFNSLGFLSKVSLIEIAYDVYPFNPGLQEFFWKHSFLKYNQRGDNFIGSELEKTYYLANTRKGSKGVKIYEKLVDGQLCLRLELTLLRPVIHRLALELPLDNINTIDLSKYVCFKSFNHTRLVKHMKWKRRKVIRGLTGRRKALAMRVLRDIAGVHSERVTSKKEWLKKSRYKQNYSRFFDDLKEANNLLYAKVCKRPILKIRRTRG